MISLLLLYFPLGLKLLGDAMGARKQEGGFSLWLGKLEYFLAPLRDTLLAAILALIGAIQCVHFKNFPTGLTLLTLSLASQFNRIHRLKQRIRLGNWVAEKNEIEANEFFETYYRSLGTFKNQIPLEIKKISPTQIDYRSGKESKETFWPILKGAFDTFTLSSLALLCFKKMDDIQATRAFDHLARIWGGRAVEQMKLKLVTEGLDQLPFLNGKVLLLFNHKSYADFALSFFALRGIRNSGRFLRPRFILAKDHFLDNPLLYSWLGLGKCCERVGMIFIDRQKGKGWKALTQAKNQIIDRDIEVAIYPQGTRAPGRFGFHGERLDAGYYTTFSRKDMLNPRGHLKKGTAQLILDTALELKKRGLAPLKVLLVDLQGTGKIIPKSSFKVLTETEIHFRIGPCWTLEVPTYAEIQNPEGEPPSTEAHRNYLDALEEVHAQMDRRLEQVIGRHQDLINQINADKRLPLLHRDTVLVFLKRAHEIEDTLPFVVLDRLYSLPIHNWSRYLTLFVNTIVQGGDRSAWNALLKEVSEELTKK